MIQEVYIQRNRAIESLIRPDYVDGTHLLDDGRTVHDLTEKHVYRIHIIDRLGFPNAIGCYTYEGIHQGQYMFTNIKFQFGKNSSQSNALMIPIPVEDRFIFEQYNP